MSYAENTSVPIDRSKSEIEKILMKYGASEFAYMTKPDKAIVVFQVHEKRVRFNIPLPKLEEFSKTPGRGRNRTATDTYTHWEQGCRVKWRALALVIKAKLEAVETGITVFEEEFLAHLVTAGGKTVGERMLPDLAAHLRKGSEVPLLPGA